MMNGSGSNNLGNGDLLWNNVVFYNKFDNSNLITNSANNEITVSSFSTSIFDSSLDYKYGNSSMLCKGGNNGILQLSSSFSSSILNPTNSLTIEFFLKLIESTTNLGVNITFYIRGNNNSYIQLSFSYPDYSSGTKYIVVNITTFNENGVYISGAYNNTYYYTLPLNTWHHVAFSIANPISTSNNSFKFFINGINVPLSAGVSNTPITIPSTSFIQVGMFSYYRLFLIDSLRITKEQRYTASFNSNTDTYLAY